MPGKAAKLWFVNVISFALFAVLAVTGLINWLALPRGYGAGSGVWGSLRHLLRNVHEWTALFFIVTILIHVMLHWAYVKNRLNR